MPIYCKAKAVTAALRIILVTVQPLMGWSNRGHRLINLVAAQSLPADMPVFMHTPQAVAQMAYLGPEPDRWRPDTAPELSRASSPDHTFHLEAALIASPLSRRRYDYKGAMQGGTLALDRFVEQRMAEGGGMLRDLIYSAWIQSKLDTAPSLPFDRHTRVTPIGNGRSHHGGCLSG